MSVIRCLTGVYREAGTKVVYSEQNNFPDMTALLRQGHTLPR